MGGYVCFVQKLLYLLQRPLQLLGKFAGGRAQNTGTHGRDTDKIVAGDDPDGIVFAYLVQKALYIGISRLTVFGIGHEDIVIIRSGTGIARAAVADPPVMILDEATSSIDTRTEALVQKGMDALMKGRTTFVIAHRLSTVMNSDCIMVLDHGRIIERGSHEDLIALKGTYYNLYTGAFELE